MAVAEKIRRWKGGMLRVYAVTREMDPVGENEEGRALYMPRLERRFIRRMKAVPLGEGFALLTPSWSELVDPNVRLDFEVRDGRLELVTITAPPGAPGLTQTLMRRPEIWAAVKAFPRQNGLRLELDSRGHVVGVLLLGPRDPWDTRDWETAVADTARELGDALPQPQPGRPRLTDTELERVAEVYEEAKLSRRATARAVAEEFVVTLDAAKKRIRKARDRGFLPQTNRKGK